MRIKFRRTGGFAPMPISADLDTDNCSPDVVSKLKELFETSGIMYMQSAQVKGARDVRSYHIEIDKDGVEQKLDIDEISVPEKAKPLIEFLVAHSKSMFGDE